MLHFQCQEKFQTEEGDEWFANFAQTIHLLIVGNVIIMIWQKSFKLSDQSI